MRAFRAILQIAALLTGQFHACHAVYLLPNGSECRECSVLMGGESSAKAALARRTSLSDCRSCCQLTSCDKESGSKIAKVATAVQIDLNLPARFPISIPATSPPSTQAAVFRAGVPPTGPPAESHSRAPPSSLA